MITPPSIYAEWLVLFDRFRAGDDEALPLLEAGRLELVPGVTERWTRHATEVLRARLRAFADRLWSGLYREGDPWACEIFLLKARRDLSPLARFCALPAFPAELREHLHGELDLQVGKIREALETQIARLSWERERLIRAARSLRPEDPSSHVLS